MNRKGFMMAEVVVVSAIIMVTLVGLYTSYSKIYSLYNQRIDYYDVSTLYDLAYIRDGIEFTGKTPSNTSPIYSSTSDGVLVYYINKNNITNLKTTVSNQTFKDYLDYLDGSLDLDNLKVKNTSVDNILIMEKCSNTDNCKYAYLEVLI